MLAIALLGRRASHSLKLRAETVRRAAGVLVGVAALAIAFGVDRDLQTAVPGYTEALQERFEDSNAAQRELEELTGAREPEPVDAAADGSSLRDFGPAPEFRNVASWLNSEPLTLAGLRGKVVLIDFWTYSCINCLRTLPYLEEWDRRYRDHGLTIVGVHSPEFAFERVESNVRENADDLGVRVPDRARQRLRHVVGVAQPLLAGEVPDRPRRAHPLLPLRRGRVRPDGGRDPDTPRRRPAAGLERQGGGERRSR